MENADFLVFLGKYSFSVAAQTLRGSLSRLLGPFAERLVGLANLVERYPGGPFLVLDDGTLNSAAAQAHVHI